ncbi:calcium-binding protein [Pseudomonas anguilliseptica]|uniref:calcium-binding protein n=1 Tax=Pseudomonas anguilliseptica TaxID=53406 RepID=UPI00325B4E54
MELPTNDATVKRKTSPEGGGVYGALTDIQTQRVGVDFVFSHSNGMDKVVLKGIFSATSSTSNYLVNNVLEKVEFADGTVWTWEQMMLAGVKQVGSDGAETIVGWAGNDIIEGGAGNDILDGGTGSNKLYGGAGNDTLKVHLSSKDNLLSGGTGDDTLVGSYYADTYVFNLGDGVDTITDSGGNDQLLLGLSPDQLWFQRNGNNLDVLVEGTSDRVTVSNWYSNGASRIESLQSSGGLALTAARVQTLVDAMASFGVPAGGESNLTADQRAQLDVVIAANWQ